MWCWWVTKHMENLPESKTCTLQRWRLPQPNKPARPPSHPKQNLDCIEISSLCGTMHPHELDPWKSLYHHYSHHCEPQSTVNCSYPNYAEKYCSPSGHAVPRHDKLVRHGYAVLHRNMTHKRITIIVIWSYLPRVQFSQNCISLFLMMLKSVWESTLSYTCKYWYSVQHIVSTKNTMMCILAPKEVYWMCAKGHNHNIEWTCNVRQNIFHIHLKASKQFFTLGLGPCSSPW